MSLSPPFKSPFTDLTGAVNTHQSGGRCEDFEMRVIDCLEAYGLTRGHKECAALLRDFKECHSHYKQNQRFMRMRWEWKKQYWTGERKGPGESLRPDIY